MKLDCSLVRRRVYTAGQATTKTHETSLRKALCVPLVLEIVCLATLWLSFDRSLSFQLAPAHDRAAHSGRH